MQYQISASSSRSATYPHSWFILNLIIVHLFAFLIILEIGTAFTILLIPFVSMSVLAVLWRVAQQKKQNDDWFVAAHWLQMTQRSKILIIAYAIGLAIGTIAWLIVPPLRGQTVHLVPLFLAGVPIFFGLLITFVLSGTSMFDAQRGIISDKLIHAFPPSEAWLAEHPSLTTEDTSSAKA
jgi:hypothetical protein